MTEQDLDFCEVCRCIIPEGQQHIAARHLSLHGCSVLVGVVRGFLWKWYKNFVQWRLGIRSVPGIPG